MPLGQSVQSIAGSRGKLADALVLKIAGVPESSYAGGDHSASVATFRLRFEETRLYSRKDEAWFGKIFREPGMNPECCSLS